MTKSAIQDPGDAAKASLFADRECEAKIDALRDPPQALEELVDIKVLSAILDQDCPRPERLSGGRPPFPTDVMVRIIIIQLPLNLSEEAAEL